MKGLNLSKFKKIADNKDWATLIHKDGHTINIAKAPLSHLQRKQLEHLEMHEQYAQGGKVMHYDEGGEAQAPIEELDKNSSSQPQNDLGDLPNVSSQNEPDDSEDSDEEAVSADSAPPPPPPPPQNVPESAPQVQDASQNPFPTSGLQQQMEGEKALAAAQADKGQKTAAAFQELENQTKALPTSQDIFNQNKAADAQFAQAYAENKIDPNAYWDKHSKVAAGLGVLLSGIGQAIGQGHVPTNASLDVINRGIDRELEVQKENSGHQLNLWKMNREALGNEQAANLATRNQLLNIAKIQADKYGAEAQGPIAKASSQIAVGKLQQEIDINHMKMAVLSPTSDEPTQKLGLLNRFGLIHPEQSKAIAHDINTARNVNSAASGIFDAQVQAANDSRPFSGGAGTSLKTFLPHHLPLFGDVNAKTPGQQAFHGRIIPTAQDATGSVKQAEAQSIEDNQTPILGDSDQIAYGDKPWTTINYLANKSSSAEAEAAGINLRNHPSTNISRQGLVNLYKTRYPQYAQYLDNAIANSKVPQGSSPGTGRTVASGPGASNQSDLVQVKQGGKIFNVPKSVIK